jgi:N-acetylglucosaminyl-diphospho-decaprenol L-rhamnosyltransferase
MRVVVCIVSYRRPMDVQCCLQSLMAGTFQDFDVVIIENGGPEAFRKLDAALPDRMPNGQKVRKILAPGNLGYAGAINICFKAHAGDAWLILNPDTVLDERAFEAMVQKMMASDAGAVGAVLHDQDGIVQAWGGHWNRYLARAVMVGRGTPTTALNGYSPDIARLNYLVGAAFLVNRDFVSRVGLMREDYFLYCEEVEWFLRAQSVGLGIDVAFGAMIMHAHGTTTGAGSSIKQLPILPVYLNERNRILLTKDVFPRSFPLVVITTFALILGRYLRRGAYRQVIFALEGWIAGLKGRRNLPPFIEGGALSRGP